jgi:hypothetical protein
MAETANKARASEIIFLIAVLLCSALVVLEVVANLTTELKGKSIGPLSGRLVPSTYLTAPPIDETTPPALKLKDVPYEPATVK